jgi:hypothetical protein
VFEGHTTNTFDRGLKELTIYHKLVNPLYAHQASAVTNQSTSFMKTYKTGGTPAFVIFEKDGSVAFSGIAKIKQLHDWEALIDPALAR